MPELRTKSCPRPVDELWDRYLQTREESARNRLVEQYLPLVRAVAGRMCARLPECVDLDELVSAGSVGLLSAVEGFDPGRKVKFETYSSGRIRGAILDYLRSQDWVPRSARTRAARLAEAKHELQSRLQRVPTRAELAKKMKLSVDEVRKCARAASAATMTSLDGAAPDPNGNGSEVRGIDLLENATYAAPEQQALHADLRDLLDERLSGMQRLVVMLYYFEGMNLKEIGESLNLSESRVCQMHTEILRNLRECFDGPARQCV